MCIRDRNWPSQWEPALHFLLDSLDEKGYYTDSLSDFASRFQLTDDEAAKILALIQSLEPAGIGAHTLEAVSYTHLAMAGDGVLMTISPMDFAPTGPVGS